MSDVPFFNQIGLIDEIKKRPALYKMDQPVDREEKLALWKEVGAAIFPDWETFNKATAYDKVLQLQRKWRSLRDAYNRELRARKCGHRERRKVYKYFKRMSFLGGFTGPISEEEEEDHYINQEIAESQSNPEDTMIIFEREDTPEPKKIIKKTRKRQRRRRSNNSIPAPEEMEMQIFPLEVPNDSDDSDKLFMLSFLPEMKQLPLNLKMWVRAQIANAMQEAVTCHCNNTQPSGSMGFDRIELNMKTQRYDSTEE